MLSGSTSFSVQQCRNPRRVPETENWCSHFSHADDEAEWGDESVARTNTVGLWQWQKH